MVKPVAWRGSSRRDVRAWTPELRQRAGYELYRVEQGLEPSDWRPMSTVGAGVAEIRLHGDREHRVLYLAKFAEAVYVLHAFPKTTQRTPPADLELARSRYRDLVAARRRERE